MWASMPHFFDRFLRLNANYFHQDTKGLLTQGSSTMFPSFFQGSTNNTFLRGSTTTKTVAAGLTSR